MKNLFTIPFACALLFTTPATEEEFVDVRERVRGETVSREIGMDPRFLYVVKAKITEVSRCSKRKQELPQYVADVQLVDGKPPTKELRFWCDELPVGVKLGEAADYFAAIRILPSGALEPTEYARKVPIPPFEALLMNSPSFQLTIRLKIFSLVLSDPFDGGGPPTGEPWLLPEGFFDKESMRDGSLGRR